MADENEEVRPCNLTEVREEFYDDDVVIVDSLLHNTAKMPAKDRLPQNVLAGRIAPAFIPSDKPNPTTTVAGLPYMYNGSLYIAKESGYQGPWDASKFTSTDISGMDLIQVTSTMSASAPYNDFDSFPLNKVLLVYDVSNVANAPSTYGCIVQTIAFSESAIIQYVSDSVGNYFIRSKFADNWVDWNNLAAALINLGGKTATGIFADLNTFPLNRTVLILSQADVANKPVNRPFTVTTFGSTSGALMQLLSTDQQKIYIRAKFSTSWGDWMCVDGSLSGMGGVPNTNAPFNDLDTYPDNRCYLVVSNYSSIANKPANRPFFAITIAASAGAKLQYFVTDQRKIYVRVKYSSWGEWTSVDGALSSMGGIPNADAPFDDFNTYPVNRTYFSSATTIKNAPVAEPFNIATIAGSSGAVMQILSTESGKIFARSMWANNWKPWKRLDIEDAVISPVCAFNEFIAIGDSITYGQVQTAATTWRRAYKSWPEHVAQVTGVPQTTYAVSGYTASDAWNAFKDQFVSKTNALAFIFLGTNEGLTDTLDTDAPSDQPYLSWADTNTGCYAKIIAKLQDLGYKIVLIKPYIGGGNLSVTQDVISQCGSRFHVCVLEPMRNDDLKYHYWPSLLGSDTPHFNDFGYCQFASFVLSRLASAPTDQMKWIIPS